jgi:hypothetical protein
LQAHHKAQTFEIKKNFIRPKFSSNCESAEPHPWEMSDIVG